MPRRTWIPYAVLTVILAGSLLFAYQIRVSADRNDAARFDARTARIRISIRQRLETYVAMLLGGKGFFTATPSMTRDGFHHYVESLDLAGRYPGIQGIGYSMRIPADRLQAELSQLRKEAPNFMLWPSTPSRPEYNAILYLEPLDRRNRVALGFDMSTEDIRRAAMQKAMDTGLPAMSGRVVLVQEIDQQKQAGFLIYVPLYRGASTPDSVEERRRQLYGFIYSPFRADDFLKGVLGQDMGDVDFQVYDDTAEPTRLLHASNGNPENLLTSPSGRRMASTIDVAGRRWVLAFAARPEFEAASGRNAAWWIALGGGVLGFGLFGLIRSETRSHAKAEQHAIELRRSEEALRRSVQREQTAREQAELAGRMKDEFLATLSHELRTPLSPMLGWIHILRRDSEDPLLAKGLDVMERSVRAQLDLIEQLLDVSRIVAGKLRLNLKPTALHALVGMVAESMQVQAEAKQITVTTDLDDSLGFVLVDPNRMQQVVYNLLSNAIKFTPSGGVVALRLKRVDSLIQLQVTDSGIGMAPDFLPYVFDRFRQADSSITRTHGGLGLGLCIVKSIAELHGGEVRAESAGPGRGAAFTLFLPLRRAEENAANGEPHVFSELSSRRVLVVEDDPDSREMFAQALAQFGAVVRTAGSGAEALDILESYRPDVLVSDIAMPAMNGMEFLREVRTREQRQGISAIPAIAVTAHAREEDREHVLRAGFQIHVAKPVQPAVLAATVAQVITPAKPPY